ncbi:hypothetical protein [Nocardia sp.]|uniref:hypothetical protein n=1 Tax=Nocardia sp. TaxID=1821 RepID=UPI00262D688F|nr:hypothetical protein [Nocardia sp.]
MAISALVVVLAATVTIVLATRDSGSSALPATSTSVASTPVSSTTKPPATTPSTTSGTTPAPLIPGYQVVVPAGVNAAWDIPADWKIDPSASSFGTGTDQVPLAGLAQEGVDYCPNFVRTNMFLSIAQQPDPSAAATDIGARMARIGWSPLTSTRAGNPEPFDSSDHTLHGVFVETSGTFTPPDPHCASTYSVYTFAVAGGSTGALVLTIAADTGVDRAVNRDFARRLLATFRLF